MIVMHRPQKEYDVHVLICYIYKLSACDSQIFKSVSLLLNSSIVLEDTMSAGREFHRRMVDGKKE